MNETIHEWLDRKQKFAKKIVEEWEKDKKPIVVIVEQNTVNVFFCTLADEVRHLTFGKNAHIYFASPLEKTFIENVRRDDKIKIMQEIAPNYETAYCV